MAKNDPLNVSYMRKDAQFLADGTWYVTTPCVKCGLVDEEVPWEEAKTPHHAGLIADQRHAACSLEVDAETIRGARLAEIAAAAREVERADQLLGEAEASYEAERVAVERERNVLRALPPPKDRGEEGARKASEAALDRRLAVATANLERYRRGPTEARKRLADTQAANGPV
jgi:hypothetical protein